MNVVLDIKWKFNQLQPTFMDVIFVSLFSRLVYTMIRIPQSFSVLFLFKLELSMKYVPDIEKTKDPYLKNQIKLFVKMR